LLKPVAGYVLAPIAILVPLAFNDTERPKLSYCVLPGILSPISSQSIDCKLGTIFVLIVILLAFIYRIYALFQFLVTSPNLNMLLL